MKKSERLTQLLELLSVTGHMRIEEICDAVDVSPATVRRDLAELAGQGLIHRTRGGALVTQQAVDPPLKYKSSRQGPAKELIARAAAGCVRPGDVVAMNGGTTVTLVAEALMTSPALQDLRGADRVTVVTNSLSVAFVLATASSIRTMVTGGTARSFSYELIGQSAVRTLEAIHFDTAILGIDALDLVSGIFAHHEAEAPLGALMAANARRVVVVADSTKVGARAFARIAPLSAIDVFITDPGLSEENAAILRTAGMDVQITQKGTS